MKKLVLAVTLLLAGATQARAGKFYDLFVGASSGTLRVGMSGTNRDNAVFTSSGAAVVQSTSVTSGYAVLRALNYAGSEILKLTQSGALTVSSFVGNLTGNVVGNLTGNVTGDVTGNLTGNVTGNVSGNAGTATALAANGSNCSTGNYPLGVDASGNVESCTALSGTISGGVANRLSKYASATSLTPTSYITEVSTGVTISSNVTLGADSWAASGATVTVNAARCVGIECLVYYSSGTEHSQSVVLALSSMTYRVEYKAVITSGTTSASTPLGWYVNGDRTAANYFPSGATYANAYSWNNSGAYTYVPIKSCGGGAVNAGDVTWGTMTLTDDMANRLYYTGTEVDTCQGVTVYNTAHVGGYFKKTGTSAPWTLTFFPSASGFGIRWDIWVWQRGRDALR